jgi:hypothetical protein
VVELGHPVSLRRPSAADVQSPLALSETLAGYYDALAALQRRTSVESFVTATLAAGGADNRVAHGLPGALATWEIVDKNATADVWRSPTVNPDASVILLRASAAVTVKLRFS